MTGGSIGISGAISDNELIETLPKKSFLAEQMCGFCTAVEAHLQKRPSTALHYPQDEKFQLLQYEKTL